MNIARACKAAAARGDGSGRIIKNRLAAGAALYCYSRAARVLLP